MKKTAVDWIVNHIVLEGRIPKWLIEKAKEMEKEQILDAYYQSKMDTYFEKEIDGKIYYQQTYFKETYGKE